MLRLEKSADLSNVTIRIREKENFFDSYLLKALAIALSLHAVGLILFQVTPFAFTSTFTFAPVHVQSDLPIKGVSALVLNYGEENEIAPPPLPFIPPLDWIAFAPESPLVPSVVFNSRTLLALEERVWPKWEMPLPIKLEEPQIQLAISGDLAELPLLSRDPLLNQMQVVSSHDSAAYVTYKVQLDEKSGEIFWYERVESSMISAIDQLTEKILLNLRFAPPKDHVPVLGKLNFIVLPFAHLTQENIFNHD